MRSPDLQVFWLACALACAPGWLMALESDRQQPLTINADTTDGTLGDGMAVLRGQVEIHQGSLLVRADLAEVEKVDGKVRQVVLTGTPVLLQQDIENEGLVTATAQTINYQVATGIVTLTGAADVNHPQYHISGEVLVYDMNQQHFQGSGGDGNGRIRIELAPEVVPNMPQPAATPSREGTVPESKPPDSGATKDASGEPDADG